MMNVEILSVPLSVCLSVLSVCHVRNAGGLVGRGRIRSI